VASRGGEKKKTPFQGAPSLFIDERGASEETKMSFFFTHRNSEKRQRENEMEAMFTRGGKKKRPGA